MAWATESACCQQGVTKWPERKYPKDERAQEMQRRELVANF